MKYAWLILVALSLAPVWCGESRAESPLADAAQQKDFARVAALVREKANVHSAQVDGMTALHWAVFHDDASAVKLLLEAGAKVQASSRYGVAPLSLACVRGNTAIVEALLAAGADPNTALPGGETALMTAARTGLLGPVKALLARGAEVNAREQKKADGTDVGGSGRQCGGGRCLAGGRR